MTWSTASAAGYLPARRDRPPGAPLPAPGFVLAAGMTLVVQPNVVTRKRQAGVQTGELLLVTGEGPEQLHAYPPGLQQVGLKRSGRLPAKTARWR